MTQRCSVTRAILAYQFEGLSFSVFGDSDVGRTVRTLARAIYSMTASCLANGVRDELSA